ncbi:MAG: putative DNA binding domain-containing protein [Proteobacteria bacterium]|nr:putative DNA binding domain-containing protein [Pseudomonadota bacterium]
MTIPQDIDNLLSIRSETERLEFKAAQNKFSFELLVDYCVALANEGGGRIILGITDKYPRKVVGTSAFEIPERTVSGIYERIGIKVSFEEIQHPSGRVLIFHAPSRPNGAPIHHNGRYLMRAGDSLVPMSQDQLRSIIKEGEMEWTSQAAMVNCSGDQVVLLLDTQCYFDLMQLPYPATRESVLSRLANEKLIFQSSDTWTISNLGAILFAKKLEQFDGLYRKAPRLILYEGSDKLKTKTDKSINKGYAVAFQPFVEQITSVMVEIYQNRIEISNPGTPFISPDRFIDEYKSRNERLADLMRRLGICEEKGSGIDKVINTVELYQLAAPDFRLGERRMSVVLFSHTNIDDMDRNDRIRACYQHCCLRYVTNSRMTNQSLRDRFSLPDSKSATVSQIISATAEAGKIKPVDKNQSSTRYRSYVPFWA